MIVGKGAEESVIIHLHGACKHVKPGLFLDFGSQTTFLMCSDGTVLGFN